MLHLIRVNVAGQGYSLFSVDSSATRIEFLGGSAPLPGYVAVEERLDDFLENHGGSSMAFRREPVGILTFGYVCRLAALDEHKRQGLSYIHSAIFDNPALLPSCVIAALSSLSSSGIEKLTGDVEKVAQGRLESADFLRFQVQSFGELVRRFDPSSLPLPFRRRQIKRVVHDCGGAAALAWTTLAMQQASVPGPWEVFDTGSIGGFAVSQVEPSTDREAKASELLIEQARSEGPLPVLSTPERPKPIIPSPQLFLSQASTTGEADHSHPPRREINSFADSADLKALGHRVTKLFLLSLVNLGILMWVLVLGIVGPNSSRVGLSKRVVKKAGSKETRAASPARLLGPVPQAVVPIPAPVHHEKSSDLYTALNNRQAYVLSNLPSGSDVSGEPLSSFLPNISDILKKNRWKVQIEVHTDLRGSSERNEQVSNDRANLIVEKMLREGVNKEQVMAEGRGKSQPVVITELKAQDQGTNRRLVIRRVL